MQFTDKETDGQMRGYSRVNPFELENEEEEEEHSSLSTNVNIENQVENFPDDAIIFHGQHSDRHIMTCLFFVFTMALSSILSLITYGLLIRVILGLTGRWFVCGITSFLQFLEKIIVYVILKRVIRKEISDSVGAGGAAIGRFIRIPVFEDEDVTTAGQRRRCYVSMALWFLLELAIIAVIGISYTIFVPIICREVVNQLFRGIDGVLAYDWNHEGNQFALIAFISRICGSFYLISVTFGIVALIFAASDSGDRERTRGIEMSSKGDCLAIKEARLFRILHIYLTLACLLTGILLLFSIKSAWTYLIDHPLPVNNNVGRYCDPMDTTECLLPFPSSFYTVRDDTTETGMRVNIHLEALRSIFRGKNDPKHPMHVNGLDGFSTSGTILFYLDGMKEANGLGYNNDTRLIGPNEIDLSVGPQSMTLLLDVESQELVPHFAEIDYLDDDRPLVIVQSAQSLAHNRSYAVILVDAAGANGRRLQGSQYLAKLLANKDEQELSESEILRRSYYQNVVIPILYNKTAPWLNERGAIQMLFDFHTSSLNSQLGTTRRIIKDSLDLIKDESWGGWGDHNVRFLDMVESTDSCNNLDSTLARILHLEIDVPHFLTGTNRAESLNGENVSNTIRPLKLVVIIPCSIATGSKSVKALVDYGHGFFGSRKELLYAFFIHRLAHEEGYIVFASDWRGMSFLDLAVIQKAFIANPNQLDSVIANIIQGFADKAVAQHFVSSSLLGMSFMQFGGQSIAKTEPLRRIFYGISQGGILGSSYSTLLSNLSPDLLDAAIITSAGTPLSLLMSRSLVFPAYQVLLLTSLHNNRCVRIFISLLQMYFDKVSGPLVGLSGFSENKKFKSLIQAGIGDPIVTTIGTEIMARDYKASMYSSNPKLIYGIQSEISNSDSACITELLYSREFNEIPSENIVPQVAGNGVHDMARQDVALVSQVRAFINNGEFMDVCVTIGCVRER